MSSWEKEQFELFANKEFGITEDYELNWDNDFVRATLDGWLARSRLDKEVR